jgi:hypothetical protein
MRLATRPGWFSKYWWGEERAYWDQVSDEGGVPGRDGSDVFVYVALSWQTDILVPPRRTGGSHQGIPACSAMIFDVRRNTKIPYCFSMAPTDEIA